jgi:hypothetical protein
MAELFAATDPGMGLLVALAYVSSAYIAPFLSDLIGGIIGGLNFVLRVENLDG